MRFKELECLAYWLGRGHIDACFFQQLDTIVGGAGAEELEVAVNGWFTLVQDLLHQGGGSGDTSRVLEDVEVVVEVGNTRPLDADQIIDDGYSTVILLVD